MLVEKMRKAIVSWVSSHREELDEMFVTIETNEETGEEEEIVVGLTDDQFSYMLKPENWVLGSECDCLNPRHVFDCAFVYVLPSGAEDEQMMRAYIEEKNGKIKDLFVLAE